MVYTDAYVGLMPRNGGKMLAERARRDLHFHAALVHVCQDC